MQRGWRHLSHLSGRVQGSPGSPLSGKKNTLYTFNISWPIISHNSKLDSWTKVLKLHPCRRGMCTAYCVLAKTNRIKAKHQLTLTTVKFTLTCVSCPMVLSPCWYYYHTDTVSVLQHIFCDECIALWFNREKSCPLCRTVITDKVYKWRDGATSPHLQIYWSMRHSWKYLEWDLSICLHWMWFSFSFPHDCQIPLTNVVHTDWSAKRCIHCGPRSARAQEFDFYFKLYLVLPFNSLFHTLVLR